MLIKMLSTKQGSPNGIIVRTYERGEVYELPGELAEAFINMAWAEPDEGPRALEEPEETGPEQTSELVIDTEGWPLDEAENRLPGYKLALCKGGTRAFIRQESGSWQGLRKADLQDLASALGLTSTAATRSELIKAINEAAKETK
ncbi:hypothetical protein [Desulfarculus baarsii]